MCDRCPELEERIAWLESELGVQQAADMHQRLRRGLGHSAPRANGATRLISVLYAAHGRPLSYCQLLEGIPPQAGGDDERDSKIVAVWVSHARKALGRGLIETCWGYGYRLSDDGMARVAAILDHASTTTANGGVR